MVEPVKTNGITDLMRFRRRVGLVRTKGRISRVDSDALLEMIDKIEAKVVSMQEFDKTGKEIGSDGFEQTQGDYFTG